MAKAGAVCYWDACTFISLIDGGLGRTADEREGLREAGRRFHIGELWIVTSHLIDAEVLDGNMDPGARKMWENMFKRRNCQKLQSDERVAELTGEIREFYQRQHKIDGLPCLDGFDALHLATAIHYRIPRFHTFDSGKKRSRNLLSLSGNVGGRYRLVIEKPPLPKQKSLLLEP